MGKLFLASVLATSTSLCLNGSLLSVAYCLLDSTAKGADGAGLLEIEATEIGGKGALDG